MIEENGHALRWECPECGASVRSMSSTLDGAEGGLVSGVREHLALHGAEHVNAHAQTSWLAPAGHHVQLWGGPHDGAQLWLPPGQLPDVIGAHLTDDGAVIPVRGASALVLPHVVPYRLGDPAAALARGGRVRYLFDARHQ